MPNSCYVKSQVDSFSRTQKLTLESIQRFVHSRDIFR